MRLSLFVVLGWLCSSIVFASEGNRLTYLDSADPYYVHTKFPKLITPQWVGEKGVEAVVILAIDDMRDTKRYETFLRPILQRLRKIDGRAPVSIMTNRIDPKDKHLQKWLKEGVSLETHTYAHPCPFFRSGKFSQAKETYDRCVDLMAAIPGNRPVAFRMPCCDSMNTPSPRFYAQIFNQKTSKGNFLTVDSSVFHLFTSEDPDLPRGLVLDANGQERFRKYLPKDRTFVNTVENYPYPYVLGRLCWQFPCMTPSDWQAQHLHKPNNPITVRDWKAALDATVVKQGVFTMVFHPHGWIRNDQIVELIDHAVSKYGEKVKFLTFKEAEERLTKHLLKGQSLRHPKFGSDNGIRLLDLNKDDYLDVIISNEKSRQTRLWDPKGKCWRETGFPIAISVVGNPRRIVMTYETRFGYFRSKTYPSFMNFTLFWTFNGKEWERDKGLEKGLEFNNFPLRSTGDIGGDPGIRLVDLNNDGFSEVICQKFPVYARSRDKKKWQQLPFRLPAGAKFTDGYSGDLGLRLIDVNEDGKPDVVFSNEKEFGIYLFKDMKTGWSRKVTAGKHGDKDALPMISRHHTNNGFWVHSRSFWWSNENTLPLKDNVDKRSFDHLLENVLPQGKTPEASLKCMEPRPGFQVELVAAEPLVKDPIAFAWGPDGKFWVVEMGDYPLGVDGKGKAGGRVKYLQDTNGDGTYNKTTLFLDNLGYPTGVMPWKKGVLITCAPEIFYAEDTNGDGKANLRKVLFTGFNEGNQQHRVNGLTWGLDNWVHCANGDSGGLIKSELSGKSRNSRGHDLRFKLDTGELKLTTGQSQFGRCRDDWGNWFGNNNSHPLFHFVLQDHYLRRNSYFVPPNPKVEVPKIPGSAPVYPLSRPLPRFNNPQSVNRFTSACSTIVYCDDLFGPKFENNVFVSEPVHNLVHREVLFPKGVTFSSQRAADELQSEFLASRDNWFRPTMIKTGPDGALWIADMYRLVIEHPQWIPKEWQQKLDLRAGHDKGRIYRVVPTETAPRKIPRLDQLDITALVKALDSPNGWQRDMVHMMLVQQQKEQAIPLVQELLRSKRPQTRLQALCVLEVLGGLTPKILHKALGDSHPGVVRHAVRLSEPFLEKDRQLGERLLRLIDHKDSQLRLQLAYSLGEWTDKRATQGLVQLALKDPDNRFQQAAILSSINRSNLDAVLIMVLKTKEKPLVGDLLRMALRFGNQDTLARVFQELLRPKEGKVQPRKLRVLTGFLESLGQADQSLVRLKKTGSPELRKAIQDLSNFLTEAALIAKNSDNPLSLRVEAVRLLGHSARFPNQDPQAAMSFLSPNHPAALQRAAIRSVGKIPDEEVLSQLLQNWRSYSPAIRNETLDVLLTNKTGVRALLDAVRNKVVLASTLDASRQQRLLQHPSKKLRLFAKEVLAGSINPNRQKVIEVYQKSLSLKGRPNPGKEVFAKNCAACHQIGSIGKKLGPDLLALGGKSNDWFLEAILDPNRAVEAKYLNYTALLKNGIIVQGILESEAGNSITFVDANNKRNQLLRLDVEEVVSTGKSLMPEGLEKNITPQQMADLIKFLRTKLPQRHPKHFSGNQPTIVIAGKEGSLLLQAATCSIYGPTLVFEQKYKNLGYWQSNKDEAVWRVQVPRSGRYRVWFHYACDKRVAGNLFVLTCHGDQISGKVPSTESWDTYRKLRVGEIYLSQGTGEVSLRSLGKISGALIDLRSIHLVPVKE